MRTVFTRAALTWGLLLAASAVWAADPPPAVKPPAAKPAAGDDAPAVHQIEIFNGPIRSVHYLSRNMSPGDQATLRDLERAENEVGIADELQRLRLQYVRDERVMEARRNQVQQLLYGYNSDYSASLYTTTGWGGGYGAFGVAYPLGFAGNGSWPYGGYGASTAGFSGSASNTLAVGVGDEGRLKTEIAKTLAFQATPEHAVAAGRMYGTALARAGENDTIRKGIGYAAAERPVGGRDFAVLKSGERIEGTIVANESNDTWLVMDTGTQKVWLRQSEVALRGENKKSGSVKPAVDDKK